MGMVVYYHPVLDMIWLAPELWWQPDPSKAAAIVRVIRNSVYIGVI